MGLGRVVPLPSKVRFSFDLNNSIRQEPDIYESEDSHEPELEYVKIKLTARFILSIDYAKTSPELLYKCNLHLRFQRGDYDDNGFLKLKVPALIDFYNFIGQPYVLAVFKTKEKMKISSADFKQVTLAAMALKAKMLPVVTEFALYEESFRQLIISKSDNRLI